MLLLVCELLESQVVLKVGHWCWSNGLPGCRQKMLKAISLRWSNVVRNDYVSPFHISIHHLHAPHAKSPARRLAPHKALYLQCCLVHRMNQGRPVKPAGSQLALLCWIRSFFSQESSVFSPTRSASGACCCRAAHLRFQAACRLSARVSSSSLPSGIPNIPASDCQSYSVFSRTPLMSGTISLLLQSQLRGHFHGSALHVDLLLFRRDFG